MKPEREQTGKKNAERYLVVTKSLMPITVWAESFQDALDELQEGDVVVRDSEIVSITKLDFGEEK